MSSEATVAAYKELVQSEGWRLFVTELVEPEWGAEACLRKIDDALSTVAPGEDEHLTVLQIRAAARQIHKLVQAPADIVARATGQAQKPSRIPFASLRRGTR